MQKSQMVSTAPRKVKQKNNNGEDVIMTPHRMRESFDPHPDGRQLPVECLETVLPVGELVPLE